MKKTIPFEIDIFSIVITAKSHNPSLLNPDFLYIRKIVPKEIEVSEVLTTPPVSFVKYKQGLSITVESEKLQIVQNVRDDLSLMKSVSEIASKYIDKLPHVTYTGVGINWRGFIPKDDPLFWLRKQFIVEGPWTKEPYDLNTMEIKFSYELENGRCNLSIAKVDKRKAQGQIESGILVNVNYHKEVTGYPNYDKVNEIIAKWEDRLKHFKRMLTDFFKMED